ncbi:MAG TPA: hypothetical protein EYG71_04785 [Leucothrix sp.]|nr:hypothetical protein [Leucothrix sp.]
MDTKIILAIMIGLLFGFILQKTGAANPQKIINMLRLKDFYLMKVIFLGLGLSSAILFSLMALNIIDITHLSIKTVYFGVLVGGAIFGLGWAISGFCPGSSIVAIGARRMDALFFVLGGLLGAFAFTLAYSFLQQTFLFEKLFGGKATLAETGVDKFTALLPNISSIAVAGGIAALFIIIAFILPSSTKSQES